MASTYYHSECYKDADEMMLDKSDALVVLGSSQKNIYAVEYAAANGINIQYFTLGLYTLKKSSPFHKEQ